MSNEDPNTSTDTARLMSLVVMATENASSLERVGESTEQFLNRVDAALSKLPWQVTAARNLKLTTERWLSRPWHCRRLEKLVSEFLSDQEITDYEAKLNALTRCASFLEFNVQVNATWYWRLRQLVAKEYITQAQLRAILRQSTIWWGSSWSPQRNIAVKLLAKLWRMGRPAAGELLIMKHHWVTRATVNSFLVLNGVFLVILLAGIVYFTLLPGSRSAAFLFFYFSVAFGSVEWIFWHMGPQGWAAADKLESLLSLNV